MKFIKYEETYWRDWNKWTPIPIIHADYAINIRIKVREDRKLAVKSLIILLMNLKS